MACLVSSAGQAVPVAVVVVVVLLVVAARNILGAAMQVRSPFRRGLVTASARTTLLPLAVVVMAL